MDFWQYKMKRLQPQEKTIPKWHPYDPRWNNPQTERSLDHIKPLDDEPPDESYITEASERGGNFEGPVRKIKIKRGKKNMEKSNFAEVCS